ncbi:MAG TPA: class I SAM-dependent methyltransferase [Ramlibacter sp.]|uniref:class I SAM-dependent methyltransferase n=1 Tax=Ramlibacter sp. TaxID=1917967 RepID=UPI002CE3F694|nr:class I SAM-dependent methyltransferase [Ramlibacter sp.]HVZ46981.1 class I SAM-dependent methyltransferase [Ramlibacter sp.]
MAEFYDELAPYYHLIFTDWDRSIRRQGEQLAALIDKHWPFARRVLDVACGIGTQSFALAQRNYIVFASDMSEVALKRARLEAQKRNLMIAFTRCDMRRAHEGHGSGFDVVVCADNALPHLLTDEEILQALGQMFECLLPGGGCIVTVRDYQGLMKAGKGLLVPYPLHESAAKRYIVFQQLEFKGAYCSVRFCIVQEDLATRESSVRVMKTHYYAVSTDRLCELMREAGFTDVQRLDGAFYQPVLIGTRPK